MVIHEMKVWLRRALFTAILIITLPFLLEGVLYVADPWGLRYFDDLAILWSAVVPDLVRGYALPPGDYPFSHWMAVIEPDGTRRTPADQRGACRVLFIGDSVTFGYGVNDDQTWVNLIAAQMPEMHAINLSFNGYNSENVRRIVSAFSQADVVLYLVIGNDAEPTAGYGAPLPRQGKLGMIEKYVLYYQMNRTPVQAVNVQADPRLDVEWERFRADLAALQADPRVTMYTLPDVWEQDVLDTFSIRVIRPDGNNRISPADPHPNAEGNRAFARAILPLAQEAVRSRCAS